ncbi:mechanosensitive ion channel protein MscS [Flavobacterium alvei]|uniref:Mechanosensitive ion channel protein MscS n=1 Tax=Flavobacterium alvei TaxID=2080416 RepID=A0A2S5A3E6_9FLAO|nr:mechanosensitive ion channel domain-containing protein [Flavobacterium alvei]POY36832.1 mechanosensitive ion channel protein MscS [Flavobacterium alvei]HQE34816.1 mechanosensitive ion channel [Flavobacterium alvei]HQF48512.1 mechanosensitive ion channel [Flavobacterium alvei]HQK40812.1 mechanosensitive ion channel [Flavobacterium alvei]
MIFLNNFTREAISTGILLVLVVLSRIIFSKLIRSFAKRSQTIEQRTRLVIKYIHLFVNIMAAFGLIIIWGVNTKDIIIAISSFTTVVGVAMIAQWSILSNITSGIILFFYFPFKIGDVIHIHDKDFPIEAEIEDIRAFYVYLRDKDGRIIVYPNNLLLQKGISILKTPVAEKEFFD